MLPFSNLLQAAAKKKSRKTQKKKNLKSGAQIKQGATQPSDSNDSDSNDSNTNGGDDSEQEIEQGKPENPHAC